MRDSHRSEAERVLVRAVDEEVRRAGAAGPVIDREALLARAREALDALAASAAVEYEAYVRALDAAADGEQSLGDAFRRGNASTAVLVTAVAAVVAFGADLALGVEAGTSLGAGALVGAAGAVATVAKVTATHLPAAHRRAGALGQPGGPEQLKLQWLSALEVRGIRPFLEQQRKVAAASRVSRGVKPAASPQLRGVDRSAEARRRSVLEQSFGQLPELSGGFTGRRSEITRIAQWVQAARASTETRPVVVLLHGEPGVGRTALAVRVAHHLRDQYRGACVVDLRGGRPGGESPLPTREALLHLLNRLGAPREQLLFRERSSPDQQLRRLGELYHQQVQGLAVAIVLDDAVDGEQVRALLPARSDSLVLVTCREPLELPADLPAWVHRLEVARLGAAEAAELVRSAMRGAPAAPGTEGVAAGAPEAVVAEAAGGLPLALRMLGPLLARRDAGDLAEAMRAGPAAEPPAAAGAKAAQQAGAGGGAGPGAGVGTGAAQQAAAGARAGAGTGAAQQAGARAGEQAGAGPGTGAGAARRAGAGPAERALGIADGELGEQAGRLLLRLPLAGRASLGAAAAAALLDVPEPAARQALEELWRAGLIDRVRGDRFRMHDVVRSYAATRQLQATDREALNAAHERLIRNYAQLADAVIRMVDGKTSTRADQFDGHGFGSPAAALRWLDDESSFITAALRHTEGVDQRAVLDLLGALCDYCLLRGDLYRLGEINELTQAVEAGQGLLVRSVQWRTGIAARQLGELDKARTTLTEVVDRFREANQQAGAARALVSLGITLHHQGHLPEAGAKIREAIAMQAAEELAGDRAWAMHALAAVERDLAHLAEALSLLEESLALHRESESVHGEAWAHFQRGQVYLRMDDVPAAESEFRLALDLYGRTRDARGEAWALTQLGRARLVGGDPSEAADRLREAQVRHREAEDARGEAWSLYYLGQALEERGERDPAVRELERARAMFSRMRDVYGLACARHHSGRVTRDQRAAQTGNLRNSGFARQLLVDAKADFRRIGLAHGEAWTSLELAVVDAGNARIPQALALCEEAARLFASYGDRRGEDWARFLRCTLLPYAAEAEAAGRELAELTAAPHPLRDPRLEDCAEAYALILARGVDPAEGWQAWRLQMIPNRHSREIMGVPVPTPSG
ncbi:ATP-binding protein [Streptomyces sp. NPDC002054]|uniref:ATP-binding protein n=1 Tax=Streptomyces sp. NPDC002054 TaxID=3154663 RepID=UPI00331D9987